MPAESGLAQFARCASLAAIDDRVYRNCATRMILAMQPGEDDELLEWRHCATCQTPTDPCACSGASWPSVVVRAAIDEAYRAGREHAREATDGR